MKILLLGEYSGLHTNLSEGLRELGHESVVASYGDSWKKIPRDVNLKSDLPGVLGKIGSGLKTLGSINTFKGFDVVQLINAFYFNSSLFPGKFYLDQVIKNNKKFYLLAAGDDAYFWKYGKERMRYGPFQDALKYDSNGLKESIHESKNSFLYNKSLVDKSHGVIPIMHEYEVSYQDEDKLLPTIPMPINLKKVAYSTNKAKNKLVIFHGLNRYGFKGTHFVEKAFDILKKKYPNDLELIIQGSLPLDEYLSLMNRTNIVIDQVNSYSCGMNGLYALAMGKVVLGGAEPESLKSLGVNSSPVINITPDVSHIVKEIEVLLEDRSNIEAIGVKSRQFVEDNHCYLKIAQRYVDTWSR